MFISETKIRVRYAETDQMGVVYHSNFFPYFESADMEKMGVIMPVVDVHCRSIRPARYDDLLNIRTTLKEMPLQHKIEFHHDVFNEKEEHLATAKITLYFVEAGTMKKTVMPKQLQEKLQAYFP